MEPTTTHRVILLLLLLITMVYVASCGKKTDDNILTVMATITEKEVIYDTNNEKHTFLIYQFEDGDKTFQFKREVGSGSYFIARIGEVFRIEVNIEEVEEVIEDEG